MDDLFFAFPDHYPHLLSETAEDWIFTLRCPLDPLWYVDPSVAVKAQELFGVAMEDLPLFYRRTQCGRADFVLTLFHSRALLAPTYAARRLTEKHRFQIVHIDDHDDLMAPLLSVNDSRDELSNTALGCRVTRTEPESVNRAIDCGVISKGSFLTAFLLMNVPPGHLFHVRENMKDKESWLLPISMSYSVGGMLLERTGVDFHDAEVNGSWCFSETGKLPMEITCAANDRIWLDVDLDAFCNRYDGDSDNRFKPATAHENEETFRRIESFLAQLADARWVSRIEAVSVAISPSFFPSDYWADAVPRVCEGINAIVARS